MTQPASFPKSPLPLLAAAALATLACGTTREAARPTDAQPLVHRPLGAGQSAPKGESRAEYAPRAPNPASGAPAQADDQLAYEAAPERGRPGLGTEWGETRHSRVSSAPFERQDSHRPLSLTSFRYNDEEGVRAVLGSGYWSSRSDGVSAADQALTIQLIDDAGEELPTFAAAGQSYVMGRAGSRYSIRIENRSDARFEAVATVDGLDVIDGQPGSFEKRGYLVGPWSTVEIDGFRQSEEAVAAFRFGSVRDSYASKRGSDRNVGVIGVAVFHEAGSRWPWTDSELQRRNSADPFPGRFAPPPSR